MANVLSLFVAQSRGAELAPESSWRIWLEPKYMRSGLSEPIAGAKRTVIAGGMLREEGALTAFPGAALQDLGVTWPEFRRRAHENGSRDLATMKLRYERNSKRVIVYAALESEQPMVASAVLAPGFLGLFKETLGEKVLVVIPNRFAAFVYPLLASDYQLFSPMIFRAFRATAWPVSVEVFEVSQSGWRCIGTYAEP